MRHLRRFSFVVPLFALMLAFPLAPAQERPAPETLDDRVRKFLKEHEFSWEDMNIPTRDGQFLYDLIDQKGYTRALEIGTSTGHSAIWIAWALSKTGGRLTTIEIDEDRHAQALENFREAGLSEFIDARLADAHDLVRELRGPFDFVFSDADKDWYKQYFADLAPKLTVGGCYTTHNISTRHGGLRGSTKEYVDFLMSYKNFETTIESNRSTGIAVSYKRSP
jgi:predicted O-methyltransferase YrrM